jgi:hypothetical protein
MEGRILRPVLAPCSRHVVLAGRRSLGVSSRVLVHTGGIAARTNAVDRRARTLLTVSVVVGVAARGAADPGGADGIVCDQAKCGAASPVRA